MFPTFATPRVRRIDGGCSVVTRGEALIFDRARSATPPSKEADYIRKYPPLSLVIEGVVENPWENALLCTQRGYPQTSWK